MTKAHRERLVMLARRCEEAIEQDLQSIYVFRTDMRVIMAACRYICRESEHRLKSEDR